jgi:hypothetical protein|tara:strand:+ start:297 stop:848 length:552 start_codon:yes stop_codon:yes gene_type:complete
MTKPKKKANTKKDMSKYSEESPVPTEYFREWKLGTKWNEKGYSWYMECKSCGQMVRCSHTAWWVLCGTCVNETISWEDTMPKAMLKERNKSNQRPQGWHFMNEYVDKEGNIFHKGVEQPDLKGTKEPTIIIKKPKLSKREKEELRQKLAKDVYDLKQKLKNARWKKDKKAIEREIKKKQRKLK